MTALRQWVVDKYEPFIEEYQEYLDGLNTADRGDGEGPVVVPPPPPPPPPAVTDEEG